MASYKRIEDKQSIPSTISKGNDGVKCNISCQEENVNSEVAEAERQRLIEEEYITQLKFEKEQKLKEVINPSLLYLQGFSSCYAILNRTVY